LFDYLRIRLPSLRRVGRDLSVEQGFSGKALLLDKSDESFESFVGSLGEFVSYEVPCGLTNVGDNGVSSIHNHD